MESETDTGGLGSATTSTAQWPVGSQRQLTEEEKRTFLALFPDQDSAGRIVYDTCNWELLDELSVSSPIPSPHYFQALVSKCTLADSLGRFSRKGVMEHGEGKGFINLFGQDKDDELLMPSAEDSIGRLALSLCVLSNLLRVHLTQQLQHETRLILEQKTTSTQQMDRIRGLVADYGACSLNQDSNSMFGGLI
ncbi:MAG: hypothetical protein Q9178_002490 [Gyalolechia marmorata]